MALSRRPTRSVYQVRTGVVTSYQQALFTLNTGVSPAVSNFGFRSNLNQQNPGSQPPPLPPEFAFLVTQNNDYLVTETNNNIIT